MTRVPLRYPVAQVAVAGVLAAVPVLLAGSVPQPAPLLPSREAAIQVATPVASAALVSADQRPQEPPAPAPARSSRPKAQPPVPPPADSAPLPTPGPQQSPIALERLKNLVALNYPDVARNGSGAEAVWILMDSTRTRIKFETQRAMVPEPLTIAALARQWRAYEEALLPPWRTTYEVGGPGSPRVDVVVARMKPGAMWTNQYAWPPNPSPRSDSTMVWFQALNETLRGEMRRLFPADTVGDINAWFLVTPDLRVVRAERYVKRPEAPRGPPPDLAAAAATMRLAPPGPYMHNGAIGWPAGQVNSGNAGAYFIVVLAP